MEDFFNKIEQYESKNLYEREVRQMPNEMPDSRDSYMKDKTPRIGIQKKIVKRRYQRPSPLLIDTKVTALMRAIQDKIYQT